MWADLDSAWRSIGLIISIIASGVSLTAFIRYWLKNSILRNKIELMERERAQLVESLRAAQMSPESAQIINRLAHEAERLETSLERRSAQVEIKEQYIEELEDSFDRLLDILRKNHKLFGFHRPTSPEVKITKLADQMSSHLNLDEIETICFALGVDFENLRPGGKQTKIRELLQLLQSKKRLGDLGGWLYRNRSETKWNITTDGYLWIRESDEEGLAYDID